MIINKNFLQGILKGRMAPYPIPNSFFFSILLQIQFV